MTSGLGAMNIVNGRSLHPRLHLGTCQDQTALWLRHHFAILPLPVLITVFLNLFPALSPILFLPPLPPPPVPLQVVPAEEVAYQQGTTPGDARKALGEGCKDVSRLHAHTHTHLEWYVHSLVLYWRRGAGM